MDHVPAVHLLEAGFLCQPCSNMGIGQGEHDQQGRGIVWLGVLNYVKRILPRVIKLKNVVGLTQGKHRKKFTKTLNMLKQYTNHPHIYYG